MGTTPDRKRTRRQGYLDEVEMQVPQRSWHRVTSEVRVADLHCKVSVGMHNDTQAGGKVSESKSGS